MVNFNNIIETGEYDHYGIRAHRTASTIGETLPESKVWVDGECTDEELDGVSTFKVMAGDDINAVIDFIRSTYCWDDEEIILVGGHTGSWGNDEGEYVIRDGIRLA